jgi:hypothetical protein
MMTLTVTLRLVLILILSACTCECMADDAKTISIVEQPGRLEIRVGDKPFATYVYQDEKILRPYFANVHAPDGVQVTRNHPPKPNDDPTDHAEMHPGIWLAFGDLKRADFWRNKGKVEHVEFVEKPKVSSGNLTFTVRNRYQNGERTVCTEICRHELQVRPEGFLLTYDSEFLSPEQFGFGDQEEMGLGFRVASPLRVKGGTGEMVASDGKRNESQVRGSTPEWVDYSGKIDGDVVGLTLMPHPGNFRPSWYHARDYGLLVANPFGENALTGGPKSRKHVNANESFRLRFGVLVHSSPVDKPIDLKAVYADYVKQ